MAKEMLFDQTARDAITSVGQWWTETHKPSVEEVASHVAALAWMGLRHLPKKPTLATRT